MQSEINWTIQIALGRYYGNVPRPSILHTFYQSKQYLFHNLEKIAFEKKKNNYRLILLQPSGLKLSFGGKKMKKKKL